MIPKQTILLKKEKMPCRTIENVVVIIDLAQEKVLQLTDVGKDIWNLIDGKNTIENIIENIIDVYDVKRQTAEKDVKYFVDKLITKGLILEET